MTYYTILDGYMVAVIIVFLVGIIGIALIGFSIPPKDPLFKPYTLPNNHTIKDDNHDLPAH